MTDWYTASGNPTQGSAGASNVLRSEYNSIATAFSKMPALTGYGGLLVGVNGSGTALQTYSYAEIASALTFVNLEYTGTLTGSTGVMNIGSGQLYKDSSGNVGIGTNSPIAKLAINSGGPSIEFGYSSSLSANFIQSINRTTAADVDMAYYLGASSGAHKFYTQATERMRIDSSGNVGIGVTPSAWYGGSKSLEFTSGSISPYGSSLNLQTNSYLDSSQTYRYISNGYATNLRMNNGQFQFFTAVSGTTGSAVSFTQAMTLDASGNVGIGTNSPSTKLQIDTGAAGYGLTLQASTQTSLKYQLGIDSSSNFNIYDTTAASKRLVIDSSGKVGIGTTAPTESLDVNGYIKTSSGIKFSDGTTQTTAGGLGVGQTWQNVSASRANNTTYTNSTGKPIMVAITPVNSNYVSCDFYINSALVISSSCSWAAGAAAAIPSISIIVPSGATYRANASYGILNWSELR